MRKKIVSVALAGTLGLTGIALVAPGVASAQSATPSPSADASTTERLTERVTRLKEALAGLVSGGTLTQAQADEVASTLAEQAPERGHRGGHGHGGKVAAEATASVLGITVEELRTQLQAGQTLAQIAEAEGVSKADLVSGLVAAAEEQLAEQVSAGRLTQERADEIAEGLTAQITERVDQAGRPGGHRGRHSGGPAQEQVPSTTTPSATTSGLTA